MKVALRQIGGARGKAFTHHCTQLARTLSRGNRTPLSFWDDVRNIIARKTASKPCYGPGPAALLPPKRRVALLERGCTIFLPDDSENSA
jgi:hypothetical protein